MRRVSPFAVTRGLRNLAGSSAGAAGSMNGDKEGAAAVAIASLLQVKTIGAVGVSRKGQRQ
jgi:hypothetical protein